MGKTINLPKRKDSKGRLCYLTTDGAKPYYIPVDVYKDAINTGMSHKEIKDEFKQGIRNLKRVVKYKQNPEQYEKEHKEEQVVERKRKVMQEREVKLKRLARITKRRNVSAQEMASYHKVKDDYWFENTFNQMFGKWGQRHANK